MWASKQSREMEDAQALKRAALREAARFGLKQVPRPPYWTGVRVIPLHMEFWHERPFRLHERILFTRPTPNVPWEKKRLYP